MWRARLMTLGAVVWLVVVVASVRSEEQPRNLLPNPGFENLEESFIEKGIVLEKNEVTWDSIPGWPARCQEGKIRISGDTRATTEGKTSLKMEFLSVEGFNQGYIACNVRGVKPNTIYELRAMIKALNINYGISQCRIHEYDKDGVQVTGDHRQLINYASSGRFLERRTWYATGPRVNTISFMMIWRGSVRRAGIIRERSMLWIDDLHFEEVGPAYPASGEYLKDDFESERLQNWILIASGLAGNVTEPGAGDELNPRTSEEQAHSGKKSLKLSGSGGAVERPFAGKVTDCVVTVWFYDNPQPGANRDRMVKLVDENSFITALGIFYEYRTQYSCMLGHKPEVTKLERIAGWHEFKWNFTEGEGVTCYIDGIKVGESDQMDGFRILRLGEGFVSGFTCYIDDVRIQFKNPKPK